MTKRILVLAAALLVAIASPASAQDPGYTTEDGVSVNDTTVVPGQPVTISARTFEPGSPVTFTLFSQPVNLGTVDADANGVATITFTVPEDISAGEHTVQASGTGIDGAPLTVSTTITVVGAGGAAGGGLPTTGSDSSISMTQLGVAALLVGGLLVLAANKRRSKAVTPERETAGV